MSTSSPSSNVTVVGIGAMGGGMARALLESSVTSTVVGYDRSAQLVEEFYKESFAVGKHRTTDSGGGPPTTLKQAISSDTNVVLVVLQNEPQCESVCFGGGDDKENLLSLMPKNSCVVISSTVTALWIQKAQAKFEQAGIHFVDCPISGGPARARSGELTMMASGDDASLAFAKPLLDAMGRDVHVIPGGAGMGSTVKMVHQLLAGVHIVAAAEALALAAKAGLNPQQMYDIVNGAAGASWMFQDRGQRMLQEEHERQVKSQLQIFVKDLDIVYSEAKRLQSPIPLAITALQQFISGQSLGLSAKDDSNLVQVYENISGVKVASARTGDNKKVEGDNVGEYWRMSDGTLEVICEVGNEPRHRPVLKNDYTRVIKVHLPAKETTLAHRHAEDSLYFFLLKGGLEVINHIKGSDPACDCMEFGEIRYGTHKTDKPLIHKITNMTDQLMFCIDAEVLKQPPVVAAIPLIAEKHELIKTRNKVRVYKMTLEPGESVVVSYPFFHLTVVFEPGTVEKEIGGRLRWTETSELGDIDWKEPVLDLKKTNVGTSTFVEFIAEWC